MTDDDEMAPICRQVWERAVDDAGRDVMADPALAAHVGSCMTCFRTLAELRDVPRLAAALRADAPAADVSDRFWDDLAARTTDAAAAALRRPARRRAARVVSFVAVAAAAAAALRARSRPRADRAARRRTARGRDGDATGPGRRGGGRRRGGRRGSGRVGAAPAAAIGCARARPGNVAALAAVGDTRDAADLASDDEGQMNEELAELDGPALLRIERSLAGAAL